MDIMSIKNKGIQNKITFLVRKVNEIKVFHANIYYLSN
jgi:hypothetical protein